MRLLFVLLVLLPFTAFAADDKAFYKFDDAFVRATPMKISAGYVMIDNPHAQSDRLVGAKALWAQKIELHDVTQNDQGVLEMRAVDALAVPAKGTLALRPGGQHLMIYGLKQKLDVGQIKSITLCFEKAGDVVVPFAVRPVSYKGRTVQQ